LAQANLAQASTLHLIAEVPCHRGGGRGPAPACPSMASMKLEYGEPPPLFFGVYPLTLGVQIISVCHFFVCLFCIGFASSVVTFYIANFEVSPTLQVFLSAWHMLGLTLIVGALIGTSWRQEFPLRLYAYYLVVSSLGWLVLVLRVAQQGDRCSLVTETRETQRSGLSFSCGMVSAMWFCGLLCILVLCSYCCYSVWQLKDFMWQRESSQHLLGHEADFVQGLREGRHLGGGQSRNPYRGFDFQAHAEESHRHEGPAAVPLNDPAAWAMPQPGAQPRWGGMAIRTAAM